MTTLQLGKPCPAFTATATSDCEIKSSALKGKNIILYFYPKDNTSGCTLEAENFRDNYKKFVKLNAEIYGISRDSLKSHENFKAKFNLPFELISDTEEKLCQLFDVIRMKNMYGKQVRGIERSTFVIDTKGILRTEWRKVKVPEHVSEVLAALDRL